jgi:integrase
VDGGRGFCGEPLSRECRLPHPTEGDIPHDLACLGEQPDPALGTHNDATGVNGEHGQLAIGVGHPGASDRSTTIAGKTVPRAATAEHVEAVVRLLPSRYRLPALLLDATGMRIGELEALTWGDVDEPRQRLRVSAAVSKTGRARWIPVPVELFDALTRLVAREDRVPERPVFQGFGGDRFRTALTRACTAAGVPAFSPHDLRHRRVSLLHLAGMPWARIGELVGHDDLVTTARTYTHVVADERELDYVGMLAPTLLGAD